MSDDGTTGLSREDFMQKYGVDPVEAMAKQDTDSTLTNHLKSLAVGAATIPTDIIALPGLLYNAGKALGSSYANDTPFLSEYAKNVQVENAQQNINNHLAQVAQSWRNAGVSDDDIASGLEDYKKSKGFEDFGMEQLSGTAYLAAKAKDTVRKLLGDERTDEQRPWTETAAEVLGGAIVPGPEGLATKGASLASKTAVTNALFNNPVGKVALKGAELATPLTTPYTATNVAANAVVGTGIDQAIRYAEGKPTAFSDDHAVAQIAATGAGIAGVAAFVAAVKGRSAQLLERTTENATTRALREAPTADIRTNPDPKVGEAIINAGDEQQLQPPAAGGIGQRIVNQYFDEGYGVRSQIRQQHGAEVANNFEAVQSNTGAVLKDTAHNAANESTQPLFDAIDALPEAGQRATLSAMVHNTIVTRQGLNEQALRNTIADLEKSGKPSDTLTKLKETLARVDRDDPDARAALPDIPTSEKEALAKAFREDKSPEMLRVKQELRSWGDMMAELEVRKGKWTAQFAQDMRQREPYYIPLMNDPLKGDTGGARLWRGVSNSFDRSMREPVEGSGARGVMESPIERLSDKIPDPRKPGDPETRITAAHDPRAAIFQYTKSSFIDLAHTRDRNEALRLLRTNRDGTESDLIKNGNMSFDRSAGNEGWWKAEQVAGNKYITDMLAKQNTVPEWQAGHLRIWKLGDTDWAAALRHDPVRFNGMMKALGTTSRWFKFFTTGRGNPFFAAKGAVYDLVIGMLTRMPNRSFGTASYLAHRFLPEGIARNVAGRLLDPTALVALPYHLVTATVEVLSNAGAKVIANGLKNMPEFGAFRSMVGEPMFNRMLKTATKIASMTENFATNIIKREGGSHGRINDNIDVVRGGYSMMADKIPAPIKGAWKFYTDVIDSVYLAPKRMFYTENYALLHQKFGGKIPQNELEKLIYETRSIGGDMNKVPASIGMKHAEVAAPYLSQTKLGAYHLIRNMADPATAGYMLPRLAMMMYAVGQSYYFRTYWNEESRQDYWQRMPEYERWRSFDIPSPQLMMAWFNGENPNYDRSLIYRLTLPPDIAGLVASTATMMQMMGVLPHGLTPKPLSDGLGKVWIDSLTPAMPPLIQALLAQSGAKLDPQGADTRGGSLIKSFSNTFRAGPAAEAASNLGQETNSTSLMMNALFGSFGSYLASGTDVAMHAARFNTDNSPRASSDFGAGLRAATTEVVTKMQTGTPDVPIIWQNKEKYRVATPAWQYMKENTNNIQSIVGMRDQAQGKAGQLQRQYANAVGGIPVNALTDLTLNQIGAEIAQWSRPNGELGKLKKEYNDLGVMNRALAVQYNMPQAERDRRTNIIVKAMQDNMEQQHLATKFLEQGIAEKYGQQLAPRLNGRDINMETLNKMMRESIGAPALGANVEQ